jgi:gamma-glutamyltranspeptidase/glutathione hydrolase
MLASGIGAALAAGLAATFPRLADGAVPPSASGTSYAVATDQADATRAALDVLASGGNAVDGAIAAALVLGVVNPFASGIGGGGFSVVYTAADKKISAFDFREMAPASYSADVLWPRSPSAPKDAPFTPNGGVAGVPGEPAGLELLSRRFGRKSLAHDASPAIALAQSGFYINAHTAEEIVRHHVRLVAAPSLAAVFLPGGRPTPYGARVRRPDLAATLARFGTQGKRAIYEGQTAQRLVDSLHAAGGTMALADLAAYEVKERAPLVRTIDGRTIATMPAPSAGGLAVLEVLGMYGASPSSPLATMGFGSSAYIHTVSEALRGAFSDRMRISGDPEAEKGVDAAYQAALDPAQLAARRARIEPNKTHKPDEFKTHEKGTSHLLVADRDGNVVALTTTVNGALGSSIVAEGTGILLNNELEDFTNPDDAKVFGVTEGGPNRPRPRARPVSSMTPTIVLENGEPILALGGSGGTRIATGSTQAALARLVFGLDPSVCVSSPRFHAQGVDLLVDPDVTMDVREGLRARGETVKDDPFTSAAVQMIAWKRESGQPARLLAASDPRRAGMAAAR